MMQNLKLLLFWFFNTWEMSFDGVGKNVLPPTNKGDVELSEDSFRETVDSYTDLGLITKLISAHLRSHSRSSDYSYHTFALVRGCSITPCKQNHHDWPTHLARRICVLLALSWCPCWCKLGWWMNDHVGRMHTSLKSLYLCESVSGQGVRHLRSRTAAWLQCSVSHLGIQNLLQLESCKEKCWKI